jgi:hypothetical protein
MDEIPTNAQTHNKIINLFILFNFELENKDIMEKGILDLILS